MAIYRGAGGAGDATGDSASEALLVRELAAEVTADAAAAEAARVAAVAAKVAAETAETNAELAETNAETAETNAETAQAAAAGSASAASTSATNAAASASTATTQASNASTSASAASSSASAASTSATNAASSASAASGSASTATTQATNAANSATAAATSATNSSNSATAAATSATNASNSATAAASSATSASGSASTATTQAGIATTQATNAATSATAAQTAETNAETAETNAAASASAASTSASNAATSATNASNSASAASTSATNASNSATAAATSATNAANSATLAATYTPSQTGNSGKFLTTNGTVTSWSNALNGTVGATTANTGAFTTLSASGVTTVSAGTVSAPAITTTGDTNTGIFFPAADTIAFSEGGVESMRIDSSGNVGIGGVPTVIASGYPNLQVNGASGSFLSLSVGNTRNAYLYTDGTNTETGNLAAGYYRWVVNGSERMRIDSSGNVGIGTSSPTSGKLHVVGNATISTSSLNDSVGTIRLSSLANSSLNTAGIVLSAYDTANALTNGTIHVVPVANFRSNFISTYMADGEGGNYIINQFIPSSSATAERMRLDSSGNLLVGTTTILPNNLESARFHVLKTGTTGHAASFKTNATSGFAAAAFSRDGNNGAACEFMYNPTTTVGSISVTSSATAYNTSSDYRLKENIAPMTGALATVSALKPVTYNWKADGSIGQGFIAHELAEVVPDCVTGEKDAVDADGNPQYQGIDTSFLVATLTAAIQELKAEFDEYKATHP